MISKKVLQAIEFNKVLNRVAEYAVLTTTKQAILSDAPEETFEGALTKMRYTVEADRLLFQHGVGQVEFFDAFTDEFDRLRLHATLSMKSLLRFARLLRSSRVTRTSVLGVQDESITLIKDLAIGLYQDANLEKEITSKILSEDAVADNASEKLYQIRAKIKRLNVEIREKLQSFLHKENAKYLQESIITVRGDRYVIPVKAEHKSAIKGFVHDHSASGSTFFIEPEVVLELNNELKTQTLLEEAEIDRILSELSDSVGAVQLPLTRNIEILETLDLYYAKATYGYKTKSNLPKLNKNGWVEIKKGRHPLIAPEKVVPLNIALGKDYKFVLLTGPNTGGKTVSLKLIGLFSVMALCGLFVPAAEANLSFFESVFCDVGDEQSIEQSLSTFSSHMTNIVSIVKQVNGKSLVLIDEIGAGTDPEEGSALAMAILEELLNKGACGIITTHYQALKEFAFRDERIENACMEFNPFTFAPVYKINVGLPGSSNAIEISKRLGLNKAVADRATDHLSGRKVAFEHILRKAEESRKLAENERESLEKTRLEAERELELLKTERANLQKERERLSVSAKAELRRMVGERLYEADEMLAQIKEIFESKQMDGGDVINASTLRNRLENLKFQSESEAENRPEYTPATFEQVKVGAKVYVFSMGTEGEILSLNPKKKEVSVAVGQMKLTLKANDVSILQVKKQKDKPKRIQPVSQPKDVAPVKHVATEINLLGLRVDEALPEVDAFLDQAVMGGLEEVRIIHGLGTGRLKAGITQHLKGHPCVKEFRPGRYGEGSYGVTVVKLK